MEGAYRNMRSELEAGMTDGTYKKLPPDWSHIRRDEFAERHMFIWRYGFEQAPLMINPTTGTAIAPYPDDRGWTERPPWGPSGIS